LPSRDALTARLEAQRAELLNVMDCVNRAHRTLEHEVLRQSLTSDRHRFYEQRVLESLDKAKQALAMDLGAAATRLRGAGRRLVV
jgi:hypothetical protein